MSTPIIIEGNGSTITRDSGAPAFPILTIDGTGNLTLNETTVSGGVAAAFLGTFGGGVFNNVCTTTLTNSTVSGNSAGFGDNLIGDGNANGAFKQGGDQTGVANP